MKSIKEIDEQVNKYKIELENLKENLSREMDHISSAEIDDYNHQIQLTARIIRGLAQIKFLVESDLSDKILKNLKK